MLTAPNQLWCMNFKGYFLTGDGYRCDPFTITDAPSRFLISCQAVARMDLAHVSAVFHDPAGRHEAGSTSLHHELQNGIGAYRDPSRRAIEGPRGAVGAKGELTMRVWDQMCFARYFTRLPDGIILSPTSLNPKRL